MPALLLILVAGCSDGGNGGGQTPPVADVADAVVGRVVDGDTLVASIDGIDVRVRMLGVDAPESVTPDRPVECYGPEAAARARALLPEGMPIQLATDPTQGRRDRFGRLLAEVTRPGDARTINEQLVAEGYAAVFRGDGRGRLQPRLRAAERAALIGRLGLWRACRSGG